MSKSLKTLLIAAAATAVAAAPSLAADKVRCVISTKTIFEMDDAHVANEKGYYKAENLEVSLIYGDGGASTLQTIITGSQDVTTGNGVLGVMSAFAKGAPVRIIGNSKRGTGDLFWYVPADSPIKSLKDLKEGQELAYSRPGSSTHLTTLYLVKALGIKPKLVSVGGPPSSRTQVMSGQVATGWSAFPLNANLIREGKIRIIGTGKEAAELEGATIRVVAANANWLDKNPDVAKRFMKALWKGHKDLYSDPKVIERYAERWKLNLEDVKDAPKYSPLEETTFWPIGKKDLLNEIAVANKNLSKPLTEAEWNQLIKVVYDPDKES